jgi:hypothetical protein
MEKRDVTTRLTVDTSLPSIALNVEQDNRDVLWGKTRLKNQQIKSLYFVTLPKLTAKFQLFDNFLFTDFY